MKEYPISDINLCTGCGACTNVCPHDSIQMIESKEGFLYPQINANKCIECHLCEKRCPVDSINLIEHSEFNKKCFGVIANDEEVRKMSSSGGVFYCLAEKWLNDGGVVFGVHMNDGLNNASFFEVDKTSSLSEIIGSKYIQANTDFVFRRVKSLLDDGKKVLFSGVPCQISGLKNYLSKKYSNLVCVDVICHGVPSPKLWRRYLSYLDNKYGHVFRVEFRYKRYSWEDFGILATNNKHKLLFESKDFNPYLQMFLNDICLRESCYHCCFKGLERDSDITLGDFWGSKDYVPQLSDGKGTSIVLINSKSGEKIFGDIAPYVKFEQVDYQDVFAKHNRALFDSASRPEGRDTFFIDLDRLSFRKMAKKYIRVSSKEKLKHYLDRFGVLKVIRLCTRGGVNENGIAFFFDE